MELVVLSGKGGTGKTTIATALSELAKDVVKVDCDVDAPNFYLYYKGDDIDSEVFYSGKKAVINESLCLQCKKCEAYCKFDAINNFKVDEFSCEGCGACALVCSQNAIKLVNEKGADLFITDTNKGILSRAQMEIGSDGSGKLISKLRKSVKKYKDNSPITIIDGSPGIGCPVISSITGSNAVLVITEPTKSGLEDLIRVVSLCQHFKIFTMVCVNKYDINEKITKQIESLSYSKGLKLVGKIPYDDTVIKSINDLKPITYYEGSIAKKSIEEMWNNIEGLLFC